MEAELFLMAMGQVAASLADALPWLLKLLGFIDKIPAIIQSAWMLL
jgi:hypothetical protein